MDTTLPDLSTRVQPQLSAKVAGELSSRYEIEREVGRGGMGVVYKARHLTLNRPVALKVTLPGASSERFLREARLLAQVRSPHAVAVYNCELLPDGFPMLEMEWIEGHSLSELIRSRGGALAEDETVPWMRQTAEGMLAAAQLGIIHRDLKPANILIGNDGLARVADFGLARGPTEKDEPSLTGLGMMGTPHYMAPEQAESPRSVDTRADIYSFGATFYHALTGALPFEGETIFTVLFRHKTEPLVSPQARNPALSQHLTEVLERCLAKSPDDRFCSFKDLSQQLSPASSGTSPWLDTPDARLGQYLDRYRTRKDIYLEHREQLTEPDVYEFPGGRVLKVLAGSMADQEADALVSSEDGHLSMGETSSRAQSVAGTLRLAAGEEYVKGARRFVPVRPGRVIVTPAGNLKAKYVFHGITLEGPVEKRICPSRDLIAEILAGCFYHADSLYVRSLALTLMGTGSGGFSRAVCLDVTFHYLARMLLRGLTSVREVRLVLYRPGG